MKNGRTPEVMEAVPIAGAGANGKSIAKVDGLVVFVTGAVPGDVADLRITKKKKNYAEAVASRIVAPSPYRVDPFCKHFGVCGGCTWQDLAYDQQLIYKQQEVVDNLQRIGGLELPPISPILGSPRTTHYRNKLEFSFGAQRWLTGEEIGVMGDDLDRNGLGFHIPGRFDRILDISECHLQPEPSNAIRAFVRGYARDNKLTFYHAREHHGLLRTMLVRTSLRRAQGDSAGEVMVLMAFGEENVDAREALLSAIAEKFPAITSLQYAINTKRNDMLFDQDIILFKGRDHIIEQLPDGPDRAPLKFRIGPKSFFQTNPEQTAAMYRITREFAGLTGNENVYDLYCGAGSITLFLAARAKQVVGAEIVPDAIEDAKRNAELNGISNVRFEAGDLKELLNADFTARHGRPDVIVTDPPRAGMHEDVVMRIRELAPQRIVYVSCGPATQARDLALLKDMYRVTHVQPIDMFPHTHHVENVVRLERVQLLSLFGQPKSPIAVIDIHLSQGSSTFASPTSSQMRLAYSILVIAMTISLSGYGQSVTGNFIEVIVGDSAPMKLTSIDYILYSKDDSGITEDINTGEDATPKAVQEQNKKLCDELTKEVLAAGFLVTEAVNMDDPYTVNTFQSTYVNVHLSSEVELKRLVAWMRQQGTSTGQINARNYEPMPNAAEELLNRLFAKARSQAEILAHLGGRKLGSLISARDEPQAESASWTAYPPFSSVPANTYRRHEIQKRSMTFRFALLD